MPAFVNSDVAIAFLQPFDFLGLVFTETGLHRGFRRCRQTCADLAGISRLFSGGFMDVAIH
jgi:hypothetical protein